jgi:hypothetical protein
MKRHTRDGRGVILIDAIGDGPGRSSKEKEILTIQERRPGIPLRPAA